MPKVDMVTRAWKQQAPHQNTTHDTVTCSNARRFCDSVQRRREFVRKKFLSRWTVCAPPFADSPNLRLSPRRNDQNVHS